MLPIFGDGAGVEDLPILAILSPLVESEVAAYGTVGSGFFSHFGDEDGIGWVPGYGFEFSSSMCDVG